jgi:hypothetical protein
MRANRRSVVLLALAFAGLLVAASPARAFWPKATYRSRVVVRGGGVPFFVGAPFGFVGTTGVTGREFFSTSEFFPTFRTEFFPTFRTEFAPVYRESSVTRDSSDIKDHISRAVRDEFARARAEGIVGGTPGGGTPPPAGTPTTTVCKELVGRMDKIDERLSKLSDRVKVIEDKVDALLAEKQAEQQAQMIARVVGGQIKAQNARLIPIFREMMKEKPDKAVIEDLLKKLDQ